MPLFTAINVLMVDSPADGIFRFFLLFAFSSESYPSTDEVADGI